ncbi:uncharacterized protein [Coffea arabica]|uniref:Uncharacterized protein n=1 Tax=Coffea arabica TaxID=13443 RepID=A0ABM4VX81_COFAR
MILPPIGRSGEEGSGQIRSEASFETFNRFINRNMLIDIGYEGVSWTWCTNWDKEREVKERIDRILGTRQWCDSVGKVKCTHVETEAPDQCALILDTTPEERKRRKRFMFDRRWLMQGDVGKMVKEAWETDLQGSGLYKVHCKIKQVRVSLLR